jgi:molybdenum cofactor biosynthesis enzyme MoaA
MEDKLKEIGFYTLEDSRAKNVSIRTPLWRCELLLTTRCNFKCPYCRGVKPEFRGDLSYGEAAQIVKLWANHGLKNIRFSGGEPTLWPRLADLVKYARDCGIERVAISTNGSASFSKYVELLEAGVNDFSISFDACCSATGDVMAGKEGAYNIVVRNIKVLSLKNWNHINEMEVLMPNLDKVHSTRLTDDKLYFDHDWYKQNAKGRKNDSSECTQIPASSSEGTDKNS